VAALLITWVDAGAVDVGVVDVAWSTLGVDMGVVDVEWSPYTSWIPHTMGLLSCFLPAPTHKPRSIDISVGWPTSFIGGERPGGSEFGCVGT
jgi:hypothetical protein